MANLSNIYSYYVKMKTCVGSVLKWGNVPGASSGTNNRISNQHRVWPFGFLPAPGVAIRFYPEGNPRHLLVPSRETAPNFCSLLPSFLVCFHHRQKKATVIVRSTTRHLEGGAERERERLNEDAWRMWKEIESRESGKIRPHLFASRLKSRRVASLLLSNTKDIVSPHRGSINSLQVAFPLWRHWFLLDWASF